MIPGKSDRAELDAARSEDAVGGGLELPLRKRQRQNPWKRRDEPRPAKEPEIAANRQIRRARLRLVGFIARAHPFAKRGFRLGRGSPASPLSAPQFFALPAERLNYPTQTGGKT